MMLGGSASAHKPVAANISDASAPRGKITLLINCGVRCSASPATPSAIQNWITPLTISNGNMLNADNINYLFTLLEIVQHPRHLRPIVDVAGPAPTVHLQRSVDTKLFIKARLTLRLAIILAMKFVSDL